MRCLEEGKFVYLIYPHFLSYYSNHIIHFESNPTVAVMVKKQLAFAKSGIPQLTN
jgi:hypothetical protein